MTAGPEDVSAILAVSGGATAWTETQGAYSSRVTGSLGPHISLDMIRSIGGSWVAGLTSRYEYAFYLTEQKPRPTAHRGSIGGVLGYLFNEQGTYRHGVRLCISPYFNAYREEGRQDTSFGGILHLGYVGYAPRGGLFWSIGLESAAAHGSNSIGASEPYLSYGVTTGIGFSFDVRDKDAGAPTHWGPPARSIPPLPPDET